MKKLPLFRSKALLRVFSLIAILFLFANTSFAQDFGEIVPYTLRASESVQGNLEVTGNAILGVRGILDRQSYQPNDPYEGSSNNGRTNEQEFDYDTDSFLLSGPFGSFDFDLPIDINGDPLTDFDTQTPAGTPGDIRSAYTRAYIDIDDDPSFSSNFSAAFRANSANSQYGGTLNADGDG